jgi:AraC family transcriptional regulator
MEIRQMLSDQLAAQIGNCHFTLPVSFGKIDALFSSDDIIARYSANWQAFSTPPKALGTPPKSTRGLSGWRLQKIKAYVESKLEDRISTQAMADLVGLSAGYFLAAFKNAVGLTPQAYIMQQRLMRAKQLLATEPYLAINEIAFSCGFTDQAHLNNRFKAAFGVSPGIWRRSCKHANDQHQPAHTFKTGRI